MKKLTKLLMFSMVFILLFVSISSAQDYSFNEGGITVYEKDQNATLRQGCDCSFVNFSEVYKQNSGQTIISNVQGVQKSPNYFTYELDKSKYQGSGTYVYTGYADAGQNNTIKPFTYKFEVVSENNFSLNLDENINLILMFILAILGIVLYMFTAWKTISGSMIIISGFVLLFNGFQVFISASIVALGAVLTIIANEQ